MQKFFRLFIRTMVLICAVPLLMGAKQVDPASESSFNPQQAYSNVGINVKVGEPAHTFVLPDADGELVSLEDFKGRKHVLLIFYRGSWCPYCVSHFDDIQNLFPKLDEYNVQLLAVSPDSIKKSKKLAKKFNKPYVFLSDKDLSVTRAYGIKSDKNLPVPTVILVDKTGVVVWYYANEDHKFRPSGLQLKSVIEQLPEAS